jgi:hypothetical protein
MLTIVSSLCVLIADLIFMCSPQPFALDEIRVCGTVFPQPTSSDRLYLDTTCFFGNIVDDVRVFVSGQPVPLVNPSGS